MTAAGGTPRDGDDTIRVVAPGADVVIRLVPEGAVLDVSGEVDVATVDIVRQAIARAAQTCDVVVVDLTNTAYIDSSMIGLLLTLSKELRTKRGELRVVAPQTARSRRVLSLSGVEHSLSLHETVDAAIPTQ